MLALEAGAGANAIVAKASGTGGAGCVMIWFDAEKSFNAKEQDEL